jgi:outer membrane protein assembly factor BamB
VDSGRGGPGVAVDPSGQGDVSKSHVRWRIPSVPEGFSSPLIVGDQLYRLHNPGVLTAIRLSDGKEVFRERLEGLDPAVSPVATPDGIIYCATAGTSYVIKAGPKCDVLARNDLGDASRASPAVAAGRIYLKGGRFLFCIGRGEQKRTSCFVSVSVQANEAALGSAQVSPCGFGFRCGCRAN